MSNNTISDTTSEDTSGHISKWGNWAYVDESHLFRFVRDLSLSSSSDDIHYTLHDGSEIRVPKEALLLPENIRRYWFAGGLDTKEKRETARRLAKDLREIETRARLLSTDWMRDVVREIDDAADLIEFCLTPTPNSMSDDECPLMWPLPTEVVK